MARKKVIVKRLNAIQNFGAMDVLCTDKTGTLTQGKIVLEKHLDAHGDPSEKVLQYGYLNSYHHTGLNTLICKGAVDEVMSLCTRVAGRAGRPAGVRQYCQVHHPVHPKPGQLAAHPHFRNHRRGRRLADGFAPGEHARVRPAPAAVLAVAIHRQIRPGPAGDSELEVEQPQMNAQELIDTARAMVTGDKGLLAMDESNPTCSRRFARLGIPQTEEARRRLVPSGRSRALYLRTL